MAETDFDWAGNTENSSATQKPTSPFDVTKQEQVKKPEIADVSEKPISSLPTITFSLDIAGKPYTITTDDPGLFGEVFNHPADMDVQLVKTARFRAIVYEAYLQAKRQRKQAEREFDSWTRTIRTQVNSTWDTAAQGKNTLQATEDYIEATYSQTKTGLQDKVDTAQDNEDRVKDLYDIVKQRSYELKSVVERYFASQAEYSEFFKQQD